MKIVLLSLICSFGLFALEPIGTVSKVLGVVKIKRGKKIVRKVSLNQKVYEGDIVKTSSKKSYAKIIMIDDSRIQIGPRSEFSFEDFEMDAKTKIRKKANFNLRKGNMRATFIRVNSKKENIIIKTPTAAMGVRGTTIVAEVLNFKSGRSESEILLVEGKINLKLKNGEEMNLQRGELFSSVNLKNANPIQRVPREFASVFSPDGGVGFTFIGELKDAVGSGVKGLYQGNKQKLNAHLASSDIGRNSKAGRTLKKLIKNPRVVSLNDIISVSEKAERNSEIAKSISGSVTDPQILSPYHFNPNGPSKLEVGSEGQERRKDRGRNRESAPGNENPPVNESAPNRPPPVENIVLPNTPPQEGSQNGPDASPPQYGIGDDANGLPVQNR